MSSREAFAGYLVTRVEALLKAIEADGNAQNATHDGSGTIIEAYESSLAMAEAVRAVRFSVYEYKKRAEPSSDPRKSHAAALLMIAELHRKLGDRAEWMQGVRDEILTPLAMESNHFGRLADGFGQQSVRLLP